MVWHQKFPVPPGRFIRDEYTGKTRYRRAWLGRVLQVEIEYIGELGSYKRWRDATIDDVQAMGWQIMEKDKQ